MEALSHDAREMLMWHSDITPSKQEILNFVRTKTSLGVYIPKGKVSVPSIRSKRIRQLEARGAKIASSTPHLLMVRPTNNATSNPPQLLCSNNYSGIQTAKHIKREKLRHDEPPRHMYKYSKSSASRNIHNQTYSRNIAPSKAILENLPPLTIQAANVPRSNEGLLHTSNNIESDITNNKRTQYCEMPVAPNQGSFIPPTPLSHREMQVREYYERLSRFAAMAWSDCSQATEKLRRLYEETTRLSQAYNALGFIPYTLPTPTSIMTPSSAIASRANEIFNTPLCSFSGDKVGFGQNESNHSVYCKCNMCELARSGPQFKVQQLQRSSYNPQAVNMLNNAVKEPLHGIVLNQSGNCVDEQSYRKYVDNQYNVNNCASQHCKTQTPSRSQIGGKRRLNDNVDISSSKMAKMDNMTNFNVNKTPEKLSDVASQYFRNSSIFGTMLNVHNPLEMTPTINGQFISQNDMVNGSRRSDTSIPSSLCSFDDQRLPCVSFSPSDDLNMMPMQAAFGAHSIFPPNALGMIRTPVVNFNH